MKIATWNVNGIRARESQVLEWIRRDRPDVVCLQEIKAKPEQVPASLGDLEGYWGAWHGAGGYSGVSLHFAREAFPEKPVFVHPAFDMETRIVTATVGDVVYGSVYVPNGGKDYEAKLGFLREMTAWAASLQAEGKRLVLCGDMNVTRSDLDLHPKERDDTAVGQRADERALFESVIGQGLVDVARALAPDAGDIFTWWAPWRKMRERNVGWRIDYVLASAGLAASAKGCPVLKDVGTSDHAPVVAEL